MEDKKFYLPIGFKHEGKDIVELPIANTGGEAEKIYTKKPNQSKIHTWFGQVLSASIDNIDGVPIAKEFLAQEDKEDIPALVRQIPFIDCGGLLMQVQRECWEDEIKEQRITCTNCGAKLTADIDLKKINIPKNKGGVQETFLVKLDEPFTIETNGIEQLAPYEGITFNAIRFRVVTLGDAIKREQVAKDQILFWRNIAFDTMEDLVSIDENGKEKNVAEGYISKLGMKLFTGGFNSKTLKKIRAGVQETLPSVKFYYEDDCPQCSEATPFFASVSNFFSV